MDDPNEDTEWNDILRARGILPPKDEQSKDEIEDWFMETLKAKQEADQSLANKTLDELDELEDEEDDRIIAEYRRKRLEEMQASAAKEKYGDVMEISKPEFIKQVTEASQECMVVVHLYQDAIPVCKVMNQCLSELARQFKATKFVKIVADQCIPNYPDRNVPTLVIYDRGDIKANLVGAIQFGGMQMTTKSLRALLASYGALPPEATVDADKEKKKTIYRTSASAALSSDEEDDDDSDQGYY
ncbi:thioredoxin-like protein [Hesseltinella vesiculosa]|uniref:Thioredoxin-like protein n=1 Tax=Hesseltinella vesiculosa TaxID=101127 RepID=A0A1X2G3B5_9FUNG|nr:thioredoxin-like protein [Hesseltinella vesiculosa]